MENWLRRLSRAIGRLLNAVTFATANGAVDAVRYQPRRLIVTGGQHLAALPGDVAPAAVGQVSRGVDGLLERIARRAGERLGSGAEALLRWAFGAAGGVIDQFGASAIDD
ncbi:MAG: hypothetical protein ACREQ9_02575, partial [Candidatus Binatia bacterium]